MNYFIGVDIGVTDGAIALLQDQSLVEVTPIPTMQVLVGGKKRNQYDINGINCIIKNWLNKYGKIKMAGMERLRAIPRQSSQTAFSMGGGSMLFKVLFTINEIPFMEIEPSKWQHGIFDKLGIQYNRETTKIASVQAAKQLFPGFSFKPTERCTTDSNGMTDAACIGLYISQINQ